MVLTGKGGTGMSVGVSSRAGTPAPQSNSPTSQDGKNSWESLWDKNSCGQGSSPAWTGRKSRSWLRATWEVSEGEPDLSTSSPIQEDPALLRTFRGAQARSVNADGAGVQPSQACRLTVISRGCGQRCGRWRSHFPPVSPQVWLGIFWHFLFTLGIHFPGESSVWFLDDITASTH